MPRHLRQNHVFRIIKQDVSGGVQDSEILPRQQPLPSSAMRLSDGQNRQEPQSRPHVVGRREEGMLHDCNNSRARSSSKRKDAVDLENVSIM